MTKTIVPEPTVVWHTIGVYHVSFDVREDAARFTVERDVWKWSWGFFWLRRYPTRKVISKGLLRCTLMDGVVALPDRGELPPEVAAELPKLWDRMRRRLQRSRRRAGSSAN